jgi:type IV secretory pathway VirD2 relaxase
MQAATRAGAVGPSRRLGGAAGSRFGRGRGAGLLASLRSPSRRVAVKVRVVRHVGARFGAAPMKVHLLYLKRDGVDRDGGDATMFDRASEAADDTAFAERGKDDRHHFRIMVSPEDATELESLRVTTRDLMVQVEEDLGTRLDWVAVDHWNTDNPHVHILMRGVTDDGADLVISRDYISRGLRARAEALVSLELGPRSEREIAASLERQVGAERWTGLDRALQSLADETGGLVDLRPGRPGDDREMGRLLIGRAQVLERLGLAEPQGPAAWSLSTTHRSTLLALGERGDIIKTLHRAAGQGRSATELAPYSEQSPDPVIGRLVERGLHDEVSGQAYVVVDATDGRIHHLRLVDLERAGDTAIGGIVEFRPAGPEGAHAVLMHRSDAGLSAQIAAPGATWLDRQLVAREPAALAHTGFGAEVRVALEARAGHLAGAGLVRTTSRGPIFARDLIQTLRDRELAAAAGKVARETGLEWRRGAQGEAVSGRYQRRINLSSGRFAMIDDGLGFQLVPWSRQLERSLGEQVQGTLTPGGGVDWTVGRRRGLSL